MSSAVAVDTENTIHQIIRFEPLVFESQMPKERFHQFVLRNSDLKIERDKYGTITIHPLMTFDSGYLEGIAFLKLGNWAMKDKTGRAFSPSTSFDLPDGSQYKADGAWISNQKIAQLSEKERKQIASIVPDFVMEVRSETDRLPKLKEKMTDAWMANGVRLAWLIDPKTETVWIYRQDQAVVEVSGFDQKLSGEEVLPGFVFDLSELKQ
ncbi:MAG: Uma2 family endonuclease [Bacteroidota bacterium]